MANLLKVQTKAMLELDEEKKAAEGKVTTHDLRLVRLELTIFEYLHMVEHNSPFTILLHAL